MNAPEELLDQAEIDLADIAYDVEASGGLDRRRFMFLSLVAAAASTFGHAASMRAQSLSGGAQGQQPAQPPLPLGNGETPDRPNAYDASGVRDSLGWRTAP